MQVDRQRAEPQLRREVPCRFDGEAAADVGPVLARDPIRVALEVDRRDSDQFVSDGLRRRRLPLRQPLGDGDARARGRRLAGRQDRRAVEAEDRSVVTSARQNGKPAQITFRVKLAGRRIHRPLPAGSGTRSHIRGWHGGAPALGFADQGTGSPGADLPANFFGLEITESAIVAEGGSGARAQNELRRLHKHGVRIAIDDFGTGFSALGQLRRFPTDVIKVDRSFVQGIETDPRDAARAQPLSSRPPSGTDEPVLRQPGYRNVLSSIGNPSPGNGPVP